jgi:hypothetical protein
MAPSKTNQPVPTVHLIESDDAEPKVKIKPGTKFEVRATQVVDTQLTPTGKVAARLCGGTSTCVALVEI